MSKTVDRNTLTYACAAHPYSNATVDVPVISLHSSISKCESTSTTTSTESFTRDPIGYTDTVNLYQFVRARALSSRDPSGLIRVYDEEPIQENPDSANPGAGVLQTRAEFTRYLWNDTPDDTWPSDAIDQYHRGVHIFCGNCNFDGYSWHYPGETQCHICLTNGKSFTNIQWKALLVHELLHCKQYGCGKKTDPKTNPWVGDPYDPPKIPEMDPDVPADPEKCNDCQMEERNIYKQQCDMLFPNDKKKQKECEDAGVCGSCKWSCKGLPGFEKGCKGKSFPAIFK